MMTLRTSGRIEEGWRRASPWRSHVVHRAGESALEPVAQTLEAVGGCRRSDAGQFKAQSTGLFFQSIFQGSHAFILTDAPTDCRAAISAI